jgi:hypothetical protein
LRVKRWPPPGASDEIRLGSWHPTYGEGVARECAGPGARRGDLVDGLTRAPRPHRWYGDFSSKWITSRLLAISELAEFADKGAFLGIGRTESLCLKRGNHFVENVLSKAFIKRSVTLQPSEEQWTTKHIDQQFCIGRRL